MSKHPWPFYSSKLKKRIVDPLNAGFFTETAAKEKALFLAIGEEGSLQEQNIAKFYILVDETDGVITDARFQAFGDTALIGALDALCEIVLRKNILQAKRIHADLIEKKMQERDGEEAFPKETHGHMNLALSSFEKALEMCSHIKVEDPHSVSPVVGSSESTENAYPDFDILPDDEKLQIIKRVIKEEVEPYIALDDGSIEVKELKGSEVIIIYGGACTSCFSATGATLSAIEKILKEKISKNLVVTPDASVLNF
ncbi:MAG: hypothetical protein S4CHLAM37_10010 [Chlamydiia bacterium]|nr:hypothetical protein [Chlamydiia bacterium]